MPLSSFVIEFKITGPGVVRTIPGWTERGSQRRALPRTAGSLAAGCQLKGVILVAAINSHRLIEESEDVVKEVNRTGIRVS